MLDDVFLPSGSSDYVFDPKEALSLLTPQEQMVVKATILNGFTERETARELGVSQPVVHRIKNRALNKLHHFVLDEPTAK